MRLLLVVQRYGEEVSGGAELLCRQLATAVAERGHDVEVLTSRAVSYTDWADRYPPGESQLGPVRVHRLGVHTPRDLRRFSLLDARALDGHRPSGPLVQEAWMREQGPVLSHLEPWLTAQAAGFDVVVFFTYLYWTTWAGLPVAARYAPTVLHPTAHDEPPLGLGLFDRVLRSPDAFAFSTPEERDLVAHRLGRPPPGEVIGVGTDLDLVGRPERFREAFGLGERPYLLCLGRIDTAKGSDELFEQFVVFKQRHRDCDLALVFAGQQVWEVPADPAVVVTGVVDDQTRTDALAGCLALAQPSYFESFSMALSEAWAQRRPALVQGHCEVLHGQALRSGGAIPYFNYAEWEAGLELLLDDAGLADRLGDSGRRYVEDNYRWDVVVDRYEALLAEAASRRRSGILRPWPI